MRRIVVLAFLGLSAFVLIAPTARAADASDRLGTIVVLNGRTVIAEDQVTSSVVVFHGRTIVEGHATGSVVVFDGATRISGTVDGTVVVFRGHVEVTEGAHIGGDLVTNSAPSVAAGAQVDGERKRVSNFQFASYSLLVRFLVWLAFTLSILALGLLLLWLFPGPLDQAADAGRNAVGATIGWGIAMLFGLPIALLILAITVVGLPLALSLLLALWFLATLGYTVGVFAVGRLLVKPPASRVKAFFAGFGILRVAALVPVLGGTLWTLTAIFGLGAATVAVWRSRRRFRASEWTEPEPEPAPAPGA
jgi:hypothetical protein